MTSVGQGVESVMCHFHARAFNFWYETLKSSFFCQRDQQCSRRWLLHRAESYRRRIWHRTTAKPQGCAVWVRNNICCFRPLICGAPTHDAYHVATVQILNSFDVLCTLTNFQRNTWNYHRIYNLAISPIPMKSQNSSKFYKTKFKILYFYPSIYF